MPEIERKFVVDQLPADLRARRGERIRQGYLAVEPAEIRVRSWDDRTYELTVKSTGGLSRAEVNLELTRNQFEELWPLAQGTLEKSRSRYDVSGGTAELDVYDGALAGLVVVEVEFPSEADASAFAPPAWFGTEVTDDPRYRNAALAAAGSPPG
jgi:CYTH domain-containing protein